MTSTLTSTAVVDFLGSEIVPNAQTAQVAILPIPFEATTSYRKGCENGPAALLEASHQLECYDDELEREVCFAVGIYTHPAIADTRSQDVSSEQMLQLTQQTVYDLASSGKFVIALGGEHSITAGVVAGYQQLSDEPFTVVQIDAHGDLRYEYEGTIHNHACVMRRVVEMGLPTVQVGIRSLCIEEANLIKEKQLPIFWARDIATQPDWIEKAIAAIPTKRVFLTIDLDGIDPSSMPGVGTPEPGGLSWYGLLGFLQRLFTTHTVIGCDVMELAPVADCVVSEFTAAKLTYKLIGYHALATGLLN
ncbi:agmatinase [Lyngbya aestuarii BL J]|uniref:Agmatinase n=1 Tax=Lyngbya aestuarii BL J TaxID=1348334 RepID=U7QMD8_9CYAN|nr:agmatinase [Lyngbya aestuarii]ERT09144.1 agmatinase [Lyngbya aestuarii BL J]